jgi:UDP-N-acetylglucosamine 1-carboxyvinyltransferase
MSNFFKIKGGKALSGNITISGNKNGILPMIAASLLTDEAITLSNVPDILDVRNMLKVASTLGVEIERDGSTITLQAKNIIHSEISQDLSQLTRTSLLFAGPLLIRTGQAAFWAPGGDVIGRRRLDSHFYGLTTLGAELISENYPFKFKVKEFIGKELFFDEASVTATEHIMMTATLAKGTTVIRNCAAEPHVQDLGEMLIAMGANIVGLGTNTLTIEGCEKLHGVNYSVSGDHIEAGSFLAMAAATGGGVTINNVIPRHYWMIRRVFERFSLHFDFENNKIIMKPGQKLEINQDIGNAIPVISDGPWPQYPSDMMSCTIVMATQATGTLLFFEKMFESRMYFVDRLIRMGANAIVCDPHRVIISGATNLRAVEMSSPDIRAGMAMLIAALCADGTSIIHNSSVINRGYDTIVNKILSLGGDIEEYN